SAPGPGHESGTTEQERREVGHAATDAVAEEPEPVAVDAERRGAVAVPIAGHREVAGVAIADRRLVGDARAVAVAEEPHPVAEHTECRRAVAVPVADRGDVTG